MKRIAVLLFSVMLAVATYGQNKEIYAMVKVFNNVDKTTATIDFGDGMPRWVFANEKGKKRNFKSNFEPINLLLKNGWEIEKLSSLSTDFFTVTIWVMKKKINEDSEAKDGLVLIQE